MSYVILQIAFKCASKYETVACVSVSVLFTPIIYGGPMYIQNKQNKISTKCFKAKPLVYKYQKCKSQMLCAVTSTAYRILQQRISITKSTSRHGISVIRKLYARWPCGIRQMSSISLTFTSMWQRSVATSQCLSVSSFYISFCTLPTTCSK